MANNKFNLVGMVNLQLGNTGRFVSSINQQLNSLNSNGLNRVNSGIRNYNSNLRDATQSTNLFNRSVREAFSRFTVVAAVTGTLVGLTRSLKNAVSEAILFEREMNKIEQASGKNAFQLRTLANSISDVSTKYGVASKELSVAARNLIQAGYSANKVAGMLDLLAQTELAATFDNINDTAEGMIAILSQFGKTAMKTGNEIDFLQRSMSAVNEVSKAYAIESADIITAVRTTGAAFESAGGNFNEFIALLTSVRATTRESAESIATGFRTIFTRVQRVDTLEALRNLGIELQDAEGKFVGPVEAVQRLSTALNSIDPRDYRFNIVTEQLGGYRQIQKVIPLIQQFSMSQEALNIAQKSNDSTAKDAETAQKSLAVQIQKTREEFSRFVRDLVASSEFKKLAQWALEFANSLMKVGDSLRPLLPFLGPIALGKIGASAINTVSQFGGYSVATNGRRYAMGGQVVPGSGNTDSVPAMLTPGEFVLTKAAAQKIGYGNLKNLNRIHKFAKGGVVPQNAHVQAFATQKFVQDISTSVDPSTLSKIEETLKRIASSGQDVEAAMKVFAREIKQHGIAFDYTSSLPRVQNAITKGDYSRNLTQKILAGQQVQANSQQNIAPPQELNTNMKQTALMFGLLATSVLTSMDSMKEMGETTKIVGKNLTIAASNFVAIKTIGSGFSEVAKMFGSHIPRFKKFGDALDHLITGFAIAQSIVSIQTEQHAEAIRKNTSIIDESIQAISQNKAFNLDKLSSSITKTITEDSNLRTWKSTANYLITGLSSLVGGLSLGGLAAFGGGATTLGIGALPAGIAGFTAGSAGGGVIGSNIAYQLGVGENPQLIKEAAQMGDVLSSSMVRVSESLRTLNKGMENLGDIAQAELKDKFLSGTSGYLKNVKNLTNQLSDIQRLYGGIENAPNGVKNIISKQSSDLDETFTSINNIRGEMNKRFAQELSMGLNQKDFDPYKFAESNIKEFGPIVKSMAFDKTFNETNSLQKASDESIKAYEDYADQTIETTKRAISVNQKMVEAQNKEIAIRNKLIGSIANQLATENAMANLEYSINKLMKSFVTFGDALDMQSSRVVDPSIFNSQNISDANISDYNSALNTVAKMSPEGDKLIKNFKELQNVSSKLQIALEKNPVAIAQSEKEIDNFIKSLGVAADSGVENALKQAILKATKIDQASDAGRGDPVELGRQVLNSFDKYKDQISKTMKDFITKNNDAFMNEIEIRKAQNEVYNQQLQIQLSGIEKYAQLNKNIAMILGEEVSLRDKYVSIFQRQFALAGPIGEDPVKISQRLDFLSGESKKQITPKEAQAISVEANNLTTALRQLADQSDKTSAVMEEVQRIRNLRDIFKDFSSSAAFGTGEQRYNMSKTFTQAIQLAMTGNINRIPDNDRSAVQSLLKQFKDLPIFNGMTGKQVENMAVANFLKSIGAFPAAQMVANDTSTPEQKLIFELKSIYEQEKVARAKLIEIEQKKIDVGNEALSKNTSAIEELSKEISKIINAINPVGFANGGPVGKGFRPKGRDTIPAMLAKGEYVLSADAVKKIGVDTLDRMNNVQYFARGGRATRSLYMRRAAERKKEMPQVDRAPAPIDPRVSNSLAMHDINIAVRSMQGQAAIQKMKSFPLSNRPERVMASEDRKLRENAALEQINLPYNYEKAGYTKQQYVDTKFGGKKPEALSNEAWYKKIAESQKQKNSQFFNSVSQKAAKSPLSNYAKSADSPYNYELQQSLKKAKSLGTRADAHMQKKFGIEPGKNYKSLEDVPVLTGDQVGRAITPKGLDRMEQRSRANTPFYYSGNNFSPAQEMANRAASNFKGKYEGSSPYERYLNADSKNKFVNSARNRYQNRTASMSQFINPSNPASDILNRNNRKPVLNMSSADAQSIDRLQKFNDQFKETVLMLNGMTMTHKTIVDGQLNIGGINAPEVAAAVKEAVGSMITQEIERIFNSKGRQAQ